MPGVPGAATGRPAAAPSPGHPWKLAGTFADLTHHSKYSLDPQMCDASAGPSVTTTPDGTGWASGAGGRGVAGPDGTPLPSGIGAGVVWAGTRLLLESNAAQAQQAELVSSANSKIPWIRPDDSVLWVSPPSCGLSNPEGSEARDAKSRSETGVPRIESA